MFRLYVRAQTTDTPANFWLIANNGVLVGLVISSLVVTRR